MWSYASNVLQPIHALRRNGLLPASTRSGDWPERHATGLGPHFSRLHKRPVLLRDAVARYHLVEEFDRMAEVYDCYVHPFSIPIFEEALVILRPLIDPSACILDAGCGSGRELERVARMVPHGEVVGIDLAAGMVNAAFRNARAHGLRNTAFFQSDVAELPQLFDGMFDVVYNSLAHHHYPEPRAAAVAVYRALRPGGIYCVIDPGPAWFNSSAAPLARWADPGWMGFHTPDEFRELFLAAGFARFAFADILPGFCLSIGVKPVSG
jgi:SAM-dependent methyltransferase